MEAVARVFLFKQTALQFEAGRPIEGTCVAKKFDIGDLWDVLRTASIPSRAVVRDAWVKSLAYSISTSPNGINVMTSICHMANITVSEMFRKMPTRKLDDITVATDQLLGDDQCLQNYIGSHGADTTELHALGTRMTTHRRLRSEWRRKASKTNIDDKDPLGVVNEVAVGETEEKKLAYADALFPTYSQIAIHYKPKHILHWAAGMEVDNAESPLPGKVAPKKLYSAGGAQKYDHAWVVVKEFKESEYVKFNPIVTDLRSAAYGITPAKLFDYHEAGILDTLMMLETNEASRLCAEMPRTPAALSAHMAFVDQSTNFVRSSSTHVKIRDHRERSGDIPANAGAVVKCRVKGGGLHSSQVDIHKKLDLLVNRGRIPAAQPYLSSRIINCPPIRRVKDSGVLLNTVAAFEHVAMVVESSITCSKVDGLKDHQENFHGELSPGILGLSTEAHPVSTSTDPADKTKTTKLPFSNDLVQINWAIDLSTRQYIPGLVAGVERFNREVEEGIIPGDKLKVEDMPQQHLPCMGYPVLLAGSSETGPRLLQLLSLPVKTERSFDAIEVSDSKDSVRINNDVLMNEVATSLGRKPTNGDIESYKMDRIGENFMWGVSGDLHSYDTWQNHMRESMVAKGNAEPENDDALDCLMDSELMLLCRVHERMSAVKDSPESVYDIDVTWAQTYSALIKRASTPGGGGSGAEERPKTTTRKPKKMASERLKEGGRLVKRVRPSAPNWTEIAAQTRAAEAEADAAAGTSSAGSSSSGVTPMEITDTRSEF